MKRGLALTFADPGGVDSPPGVLWAQHAGGCLRPPEGGGGESLHRRTTHAIRVEAYRAWDRFPAVIAITRYRCSNQPWRRRSM